MGAVIGIDFGTTSSKIAYMQNGIVMPVINKAFATEITPSVVGINPHMQELKVGPMAERLTASAISDIKRRMGEPGKIKLGERDYSPEEVASFIFKYLKTYGEDYLDDRIEEAVIAVPSYFGAAARTAVQNAAEMAGIKVLKIIKEPVAIALSFSYGKNFFNRSLFVYDFGGGNFNASVVRFEKNSIDLLAFEEIKYLGGEIYDQRIIRFIKEYLIDQHGIDTFDDTLEQKIKSEAKKAKEALSAVEGNEISIKFPVLYNQKLINVNIQLAKATLDSITEDLINETISAMDWIFKSGRVAKESIEGVIMAGGASQTPAVKNMLTEYFGFPPYTGVEPELAVSFGAAIQAGIIKGAANSVLWI